MGDVWTSENPNVNNSEKISCNQYELYVHKELYSLEPETVSPIPRVPPIIEEKVEITVISDDEDEDVVFDQWFGTLNPSPQTSTHTEDLVVETSVANKGEEYHESEEDVNNVIVNRKVTETTQEQSVLGDDQFQLSKQLHRRPRIQKIWWLKRESRIRKKNTTSQKK